MKYLVVFTTSGQGYSDNRAEILDVERISKIIVNSVYDYHKFRFNQITKEGVVSDITYKESDSYYRIQVCEIPKSDFWVITTEPNEFDIYIDESESLRLQAICEDADELEEWKRGDSDGFHTTSEGYVTIQKFESC